MIFSVKTVDDQINIKIEGNIDEDAFFSDIKTDDIKTISINLEKVDLINSCGIRSWFYWIRKISDKINIYYTHCPVAVVDQINISKGFLPETAVVNSFFVPYYCDECEYSEDRILEREKDYKEASDGEEAVIKFEETLECPECKGELKVDIIAKKYFKFLQNE